MKRYCQTQLDSESGKFVHVPGRKGTALRIDEVFVPLTLELGDRKLNFSSEDLLEAGSRLIIVGDPGSGKSTLIKRLFREECRNTSVAPRIGNLPIRLELKSLIAPKELKTDADAGEWLFSQLRSAVQQVEGFEMIRLFDSWATDAGLLVLLDGLDEVGSEQYIRIAAGLRGLSQKLSALSRNSTIVITMRTQFYQQVHMHLSEYYPQTLYVRPFEPNEIYLFLNRWPFEDDAEHSINRIYADLTDRPTLREMCRNPLVLAMYVESDRESTAGELPNTRTEFYQAVVNELLIKRRRRQDLVSRATSALREQREIVLGRLALDNLLDPTQPINSLSWKRAITVASDLWACTDSEAEDRLYELSSETGLISEERHGESFCFIHQTFCEFLGAIECANSRETG
jgi:predicted NACHT family NTPase